MKPKGAIFKNVDERWDIVFDDQTWCGIGSGMVIEVKVKDQWIRTRIEHGPEGYYSIVDGINLKDGLPVRLP